MLRTALALGFIVSTVSTALPATADEAPDQTRAPYFLINGSSTERLPLKETTADVRIAGTIAHVRLNQVYENQGAIPIEATYVFPGSTRAAVFGMRMTIGQRTIKAKIEKKAEARRQYERAKQQGKSASLLEQNRPNVFTMNVANIMPGDRIVVRLDYTELVVPTDGVYELVIPTVVGPRFSADTPRETWIDNPHLAEGQAPTYKWDLTAQINAPMGIRSVTSPSHQVSPTFLRHDKVRIDVDDDNGGNRDFVLRYRLSDDAIETGLVLFERGNDKYFLLMMEPPKRIAPAMIPPREYIFVLDVSGSMNGFPINVSKKLMRELFATMRPQDRFNIMLFAGGSNVMSPKSVPASPTNIDRAMHMIDRERGGGGTQLLPAMRRALALPRTEDMSTSIVVLTDGYVSVEKETFDVIRSSLGTANLFTFGIGSSVNRHLIEGMARAGMGEPFVVLKPEQAAAKAEALKKYIESPVLTRVAVDFDGFNAFEVEPKSLPDLFSSKPVVVFGKYKGKARGTIRISGVNGNGDFSRTLEASDFTASDDNVALEYLWARHRIARLSDDGRFARENVEAEVTRLGLKHSLMTAHTSFVAIDSLVRNHTGAATSVAQPLPLPEGVSNNAVAYGSGMAMKGRRGSVEQSITFSGGAVSGRLGAGGLGTRGAGVGGGGHSRGANGIGDLSPAAEAPPPVTSKPAPRPSPKVSLESTPIVMGSLDKTAIQKIIRRHRRAVMRVYEQALKNNPKLSGKIVVKLTIGADGRVKSATIGSSTLNDKTVEQGILRVMRRMRFPAPSGGGEVVISYPFVFRTGG